METSALFTVLDSVDSTNNYAMGKVHAGLARHGAAWFAREQTQGKGQRGKTWEMEPGLSILMTVVLQPPPAFTRPPFLFIAAVATACFDFFNGYAGTGTTIKWPNDIYFGDRKAGGILIENIFQGREWKWAVVGIGININQIVFNDNLKRAVSLRQATGKSYDVEQLGRGLHALLLERISNEAFTKKAQLVEYYNTHLYKRGRTVKLKKENIVFETTIKGVSELGQLLTEDVVESGFDFGEVEWIL